MQLVNDYIGTRSLNKVICRTQLNLSRAYGASWSAPFLLRYFQVLHCDVLLFTSICSSIFRSVIFRAPRCDDDQWQTLNDNVRHGGRDSMYGTVRTRPACTLLVGLKPCHLLWSDECYTGMPVVSTRAEQKRIGYSSRIRKTTQYRK